MLTAVFLTLWAMLVLGPDTPVGHILRHWLVGRPAARLARVTRGQVVLVGVFLALAGVAFWADGDLARVMAMASPDLAAMFAALDATTLVNGALALIVTIAAAPWRSVYRRFSQGRPRPRSRRALARRLRPPSANDDERPAVAVAA